MLTYTYTHTILTYRDKAIVISSRPYYVVGADNYVQQGDYVFIRVSSVTRILPSIVGQNNTQVQHEVI